MKKKIRIGILISGGGTNMKAIVESCRAGKTDADVVFVGADNSGAKGLVWAEKQGIPTFVVDYKEHRQRLKYLEKDVVFLEHEILAVYQRSIFIQGMFGGDQKKQFAHIRWKFEAEKDLLENVRKYDVDLLILAGFMQICTSFLIDSINNGDSDPRIMNIHPTLLPSFPGVNGYADTINYGCKVGGCTVHFVDYGEDTGPIIGQRSLAVLPGDDVESFKERGLREEHQLFLECIQLFVEKKLTVKEVEYGNGKTRKVVNIRI
jgi:phosphoribosylglycinamide formyltransferase-1